MYMCVRMSRSQPVSGAVAAAHHSFLACLFITPRRKVHLVNNEEAEKCLQYVHVVAEWCHNSHLPRSQRHRTTIRHQHVHG